MSRDDPQLKIRLPLELKEKITESAAELGRSINADVVARLEDSFKPKTNEQDQTQMMQTAMVQIIVAATKAFGKKGLEWPDIQENLVEATNELIENINNKKAP